MIPIEFFGAVTIVLTLVLAWPVHKLAENLERYGD